MQQEVRVRTGFGDGNFTDEYVKFEGREVEVWEGVRDSIDPDYQFSYTVRIYECPDGYRVRETIESLSPGQENDYALYPVIGHPDSPDLVYVTCTKEEAREKWGGHFGYLLD